MATLALSLGIGSATAIYSVVHAVLLKPLGYPDAERMVVVWHSFTTRPGWRAAFSWLDSLDFAARSRTTEAFGCLTGGSFNVTYNRQATRVEGAHVTPALVHAMGIQPELGRWFQDEAKEPGGVYTAVISDSLWKRFGGNPDILGKPLTMNGRQYTILGVMPPGYSQPPWDGKQIWVPLNPDPDQRKYRGYNYLSCLAMLSKISDYLLR